LYIAVCGGDVSFPRSHSGAGRRRRKNEETRLTWFLKDEVNAPRSRLLRKTH
jgi:hypothetical protein